jgi:putative N6-adenine-specific DNA methylase
MADNFQMIAKTLFGLESVLAAELRDMGAGKVKEGVRCAYFEGDQGFMYKANLCLRTALRILKPVKTFRLKHPEDLYDCIQEINWNRYLDPRMTFVVDTVLNSDHFSHSLFVSQKVKDAIADQFRKKSGVRPSVSVTRPDVRIHLHLQGSTVHLSLDSSGSSLHRRGYRKVTNKAPLNEVLAAGILLLSGWRGQSDLLEPY